MTDRLECPRLREHGVRYDNTKPVSSQDNWWIRKFCFTSCPYKKCVYDGVKRFDIQQRNEEIARLSKSKTTKELSEMFGLSISTINRSIRESN